MTGGEIGAPPGARLAERPAPPPLPPEPPGGVPRSTAPNGAVLGSALGVLFADPEDRLHAWPQGGLTPRTRTAPIGHHPLPA